MAAYLFVLGILGLAFGSFSNVVIWRFPRGESIWGPPSACPACGERIRWRDNVPILSWLVLRGLCRDCGETISPRYPIVEGVSAALWVLAGWRFGLTWEAAATVFLFQMLLVLTFIDLDVMRLPNPLVAALAATGLVAAGLTQLLGGDAAPIVGRSAAGYMSEPLIAAGSGILLGFVPSLGIGALYTALRGRSGLGGGDIKLLGALGPFVGPYVVMVLFLGSVVGAVAAVPMALLDRRRRQGTESGEESIGRTMIPFGPFLAVGSVVTVVAGPSLLQWYLGLLRF